MDCEYSGLGGCLQVAMLEEDEIYWDKLRAQSLRPGGFGKERTSIWPTLLGVHAPSEPPPYTEISAVSPTDDAPHPDERQVRLDTDRSFVIYSDDNDENSKESLQSSLNGLIVSLLRKRRKLHYFQGYHDIVTVIFLTLPPELQLPCVEKLSLHRVRDSMGPTLEPVLGLLRIMRNLLRVVDPEYARLLESVSPLPFHALSNLLTLFSHEVPTLPLIQHVWDFLLCREPLAVVWLAVAVVLARKPDVLKLAAEGEDGMIHSILNALPLLHEGSEAKKDVSFDQDAGSRSSGEIDQSTLNMEMLPKVSDESIRNESPIEQQMAEQGPRFCLNESGAFHGPTNDQIIGEENKMVPIAKRSADEIRMDNNSNINANTDFVQPSQLQSLPESHSTSPRASRPRSLIETRSLSFIVPPVKSTQALISLPSLLTHAAQLLEAYPPSLPALHANDILGPKSATHTWRPLPRETIFSVNDERDDEAESWVGGPDVVLPFVEDEDIEENRKTKSRKGPITQRRRPFFLPGLRLRLGVLTPTEKRVLLVGALVVVGLAITLRQNRSLADMKKGWVAWAYAFVGSGIA